MINYTRRALASCHLTKRLQQICTVCALFNLILLLTMFIAQILEEFSWYDNLAAILGGNPALSLKTISSAPGVDHASKSFSLMQASTAGSASSSSSTQYGGYAPSAQPPPPSAQFGGWAPCAQHPPLSTQPPPLSAQPAPLLSTVIPMSLLALVIAATSITLALVPSLTMRLAPTLQRPPPIKYKHLSLTLILAKASSISPSITRMEGWTTTTMTTMCASLGPV